MSKKETINNVMKHKRIIIFSLIIIGLIILIMLVYILTYANNKPKAFTSDKNVKITNKCDYFDFTAVADEISLKENPKIKLKGKISNVDTDYKISEVNVTFEVHTNWTNKTDVTDSSSYKFNDGKTLTNHTSDYYSTSCTLNLKQSYPVKVMPLVKVNKPTVYAKVSYTRTTPASAVDPDGGKVTETVYYKICYNDLFYADTKVIG